MNWVLMPSVLLYVQTFHRLHLLRLWTPTISINTVLYFAVLATGSSIRQGKVEKWGPKYAIDGLVASQGTKLYHSHKEIQPWFQLEFVKAAVVKGVTFTNRISSHGDRFQNVGIYVGDQPAVIGGLVTNPECAIFEGPSADGSIEHIMCRKPLVGRYLQVQLREPSPSILQINEIEVLATRRKSVLLLITEKIIK
jgi:hypothetical protein